MLIEEMETATELFLVMELVKVRDGETPGESVKCWIPRLSGILRDPSWKCTLLP